MLVAFIKILNAEFIECFIISVITDLIVIINIVFTGAVSHIQGDERMLVPEPRRPAHRAPHQKDPCQHRHARLHQAVSAYTGLISLSSSYHSRYRYIAASIESIAVQFHTHLSIQCYFHTIHCEESAYQFDMSCLRVQGGRAGWDKGLILGRLPSMDGVDIQATSMTPDSYLLDYIRVISWRSIYLILLYGLEVVVICFRYQLRKFKLLLSVPIPFIVHNKNNIEPYFLFL